jgi:hypothetical protein
MDLSLEKLKEALSLREQIHSLEARLGSLFGGGSTGGGSTGGGGTASGEKPARVGRGRGGRRPMSAATRAKLVAAAKARWAGVRSAEGATAKPAKKGRRRSGLTAAGRKKLSDSMKARWAARRRAAGKGK